MKYRIHGHRHADFLFRELGEYACLWGEIEDALASISDDMIIKEFEGEARKAKSISQDRKSTRLNSSHSRASRMPSSA